MLTRIFSAFLLVCFATGLCAAEPDWNQFRGPNHDNKSFTEGIAKSWPQGGPKLLWRKDNIGIGYSNFSFFGDTMFTMGDVGNDCILIALDRKTGERKWTAPVGKSGVIGRYAGPRSTPAVDGKNVFAFGHFGDLLCVDMKTGKEVWGGDVVQELGGKYMNNWGFASSPVFDNDLVLVPIGGQGGTLMAFWKNGKQAWRTTGLKDDAPYASIVPAEIEGMKQYLLYTGTGVHGVDPKNGNILWGTVRSTDRPVCSDPVCLDGVVAVSSAYGMGANGYRVSKKGNKFTAVEIYQDKNLENHHGGMILHEGYIYMATNRNLVCMDITTGKVVWENRCVGKGSMVFVDGYLIVRSESGDGTIALVEATPSGYKEKGRFNQPDRTDKNSWTYPVIVDGRMYIRDQNILFCYDLK